METSMRSIRREAEWSAPLLPTLRAAPHPLQRCTSVPPGVRSSISTSLVTVGVKSKLTAPATSLGQSLTE